MALGQGELLPAIKELLPHRSIRLPHWAGASPPRPPQSIDRGGLFCPLTRARMFFRFAYVRSKKRAVTRMVSGVVTFGAPPPVALREGPTGRMYVKGPANPEGFAGPHSPESRGALGGVPGGEGDSLRNVRRGDWI
jgi:hypothetical protein